MAFGDMFKNSNFAPGSAEFKRMMGLSVDDAARTAAGDNSNDLMIVSKADFRRAAGVDIASILAGGGNAAPAAAPSPTPTPTPTDQPASGGVIVVNPLLDLDLAPVRPGDLITAASYNALIAACASLHVRLSILEARAGTAAPTPTPTTTPTPGASTPPVTRLPPDLRAAYVINYPSNGKQLTAILASGQRLMGITNARLVYRDAAGKQIGSTSLPTRRTNDTAGVFAVDKPSRTAAQASSILLVVSNADGEDQQLVERPTSEPRLQFEDMLRRVDDPLNLLDSLDAEFRRFGLAASGRNIAGNPG